MSAFEVPFDPNFDLDALRGKMLSGFETAPAECGPAYCLGTRISKRTFLDMVLRMELHCGGARLSATRWVSVETSTQEVHEPSITRYVGNLSLLSKDPVEILRALLRKERRFIKATAIHGAARTLSSWTRSLDGTSREFLDSSKLALELRKAEVSRLASHKTGFSADKRLRELEALYTPKATVTVLGLALIETPVIEIVMLERKPSGETKHILRLNPVTGGFEIKSDIS